MVPRIKVSTPSIAADSPGPSFGHWGWILPLIIGSGSLATTGDSFWIDESVTAELANQPTLKDCWGAMRRLPEIQLPFYMLYIWTYVQVFGSGEWVMRAAGLPWFILGATIFVRAMARVIGSILIPTLLVSWSAFAWYYLNEARVYSVQIGLCLATIGAAIEILTTISAGGTPRNSWRMFLASLVLFCGTSILGALWGFCFFLILLALVRRSNWVRLGRLAPWTMLACGGGLAALAAYYGWTMTLNARPSAIAATTPRTIVFVFYELFGATGWGPGRYDLREQGPRALVPFLVPVGIFAFLTAIVFWNGLRELALRFTLRRVGLVAAGVVAPFAILCIMGILTHFRVLGRHASSLLPLALLVMAYGVMRLAQRGRLRQFIAGSFLLLCLGSGLLIRFSDRHEKDDYRGAAAVARRAAAAGKQVWWNADTFSATYYGAARHERINILFSPTLETLRNEPEPDVVMVSKPDIYDPAGGVAAYLREKRYRIDRRLPAFVIWVKEP